MHVYWFQARTKPRCNFGAALERLLEKHGGHVHGLAQRMGMTYMNLYYYVWGQYKTNPIFVRRIAKAARFTEDETNELLAAQAKDPQGRPPLGSRRTRFGQVLMDQLTERGMTLLDLNLLLDDAYSLEYLTRSIKIKDDLIDHIVYSLELNDEEIEKLYLAREQDKSQ